MVSALARVGADSPPPHLSPPPDLDLPKKKRDIPVVEGRRKKMHRCALVALQ